MSKIIFAHFDTHGTATAAVLARRIGAMIITKFPETGPQLFPRFLRTLDLYNKEVYIVDIPINVHAPKEFLDALRDLRAQASYIEYIDHHETDLKYLWELSGISIKFFSSAADMAVYVVGGKENIHSELGIIALIGVVSDRDKNVLKLVDRETVERQLLPLANVADVLVRQNPQEFANRLVNEGIEYLRRSAESVVYPPYRLVNQLDIAKRGARTLLLRPVDTVNNRDLEGWLPKTLEQLLLRERRDYVVVPTAQIDRRTNEAFWSVRVLQYWLSDLPTADEIVSKIPDVQGRQKVGHATYISIRAVDISDAMALAEQIYEELERPASRVARLINEAYVAKAIDHDFSKIMEYLERIARALERGAEAKEKQVSLLEKLYERDKRTRYD